VVLPGCAVTGKNLASSISDEALQPVIATEFQPPLNASVKAAELVVNQEKPIIDGLQQTDNAALITAISFALGNNHRLEELNAVVIQAKQQLIITQAEQGFSAKLNNTNSLTKNANNSAINKNFDLSLNTSLPIDLWGAIQASNKAARIQLAIAQSDLKQSRRELISKITSAWYQVVFNKKYLVLGIAQEKNIEDQLAAVESAYRQGLKQSLDVYLARENLETALSRNVQRRQNVADVTRDLQQLLARYPSGNLIASDSSPIIDNNYRLGVPAELLQARADLNSRWLAVLKEDSNVANQYAAQFPQLTLSGNFSLTAARLGDLFKQNLAWSLITGLSQPLFDNGRKKALYDQAKAKLIEREQQYLQALHSAFKQVERLIAAEQSYQQQNILNTKAVKHAELSKTQVSIQYQNGIADYQQVLTIQSRLFDRQQALLELKMQMIATRVDLLLALGEHNPNYPIQAN
jgi:outer membrane protein TolC